MPGLALAALALLAAGCTNNTIGVGTPVPAATADASAPPPAAPNTASPPASAPPPSPSLKDKIANFFSGSSAKDPQPVTNAQSDVDCPFIDIRQGASTLTIPPPPPDGSNEAMTLKYQGTFTRAARECNVAGNQLVMKVGVQGRVIVGPAGGPGVVDVPLRIAVVNAPTAGAKVVVTKLVRIPVSIGPNDDGAAFTHIEEGLAFPMPSAAALDGYIVYIGFDPIGAAAEDHQKAPPKAKPKVRPNPNTPTG